MTLRILAFMGILVGVLEVQAEPKAQKSPRETTSYKDKTVIDFDAALVDGQFQNPEGSAVKGDQNLSFDSMLEPKKNFSDQMMRFSGAVR
jgi:hypothetical protein